MGKPLDQISSFEDLSRILNPSKKKISDSEVQQTQKDIFSDIKAVEQSDVFSAKLTTVFSQTQKERSLDFERRRTQLEVLYPVKYVELAIYRVRKRIFRKKHASFIKKIQKKDFSDFPENCVITREGELFFDLLVLKDEQKLKQFPEHIQEFLKILDEDLTALNRMSVATHDLEMKNSKSVEKIAGDKRQLFQKEIVDYSMGLGSEESMHSFPNEEVKLAYKKIETLCQTIVDNLYTATGLKNFIPKVKMTRSEKQNAFVWSFGNEATLKEYLEYADRSENPVELPIFINIGLFEAFSSIDELAAVLAHEFGHLLQPTYLTQKTELERQRLEYDADKTAITLLDTAGYSPQALSTVMNNFSGGRFQQISSTIGLPSSHPPTSNRIVEMEREYNRPDLTLFNADKKIEHMPQEITDAVLTIKNHRLKFDTTDLIALEKDNKLEQYFKDHSGPEVFLRANLPNEVIKISEERLRKEFRDQELIYGERGFKQEFFNFLNAFQLALDLQKKATNDLRIIFDLPITTDIRHQIEDKDVDDFLTIPKRDVFAGTVLDLPAITPNNFEDFYHIVSQKFNIENPPKLLESTVEEWISIDNPDTKKFWNYVGSRQGGLSTRGQRLEYLQKIFYTFLFQRTTTIRFLQESPFILCVQENIKRTYKEKQRKFSDNNSVKDRIVGQIKALGNNAKTLRTHIIVEPEEYEYVDHIVVTETNSYKYNAPNNKLIQPNIRLYDSSNPVYPVLIEDFLKLTREKQREAFVHFLKQDGLINDDPKVIDFAIRLITEKNLEKQIDEESGDEKLGVTFLNNVLEVLTRNGLENFLGDDGTLRRDLKKIIAFHPKCKPINNEEQGIRTEILKDICLDTTSNKMSSELRLDALNELYQSESSDAFKNAFEGQNDSLQRYIRHDDIEFVENVLIKPLNISFFDKRSKQKKKIVDAVCLMLGALRKKHEEIIEFDFMDLELMKNFIKHSSYEERKLQDYLLKDLFEIWSSVFFNDFGKFFGVAPTIDFFRKLLDYRMWSIRENGKFIEGSLRLLMEKPKPEDFLSFEEYSYFLIEADYNYLEKLAKIKPEAQLLLDFINKTERFDKDIRKRISGKFIFGGTMPDKSFWERSLYSYEALFDHWFSPNKKTDISLLVKYIRLVLNLNKEKFENLEIFKKLDAQASIWEWHFANILIKKTFKDGKNIINYIYSKYGEILREKYSVDYKGMHNIRFSWPLFIEDLMSDNLDMDSLFAIPKNADSSEIMRTMEKRSYFEEAAANLKAELLRVIEDPENIEFVLKMQPGFFKEFFLFEKMKRKKVTSLEEIEQNIDYFVSLEHEASENNQVTGLIEIEKNDVRDKKRKELIKQAARDFFGEKEVEDWVVKIEDSPYFLSDYDYKLWSVVEGGGLPVNKFDPVWARIETRYHELVKEERAKMAKSVRANEEEVYVFSDRAVEEDKITLQVGPVYRYRLIAQPLMEWHSRELQKTSSADKARNLLTRVTKAMPKKHPLRDIFIKNQMFMEILHVLKADLTADELQKSGIELSVKEMDLNTILSNYPKSVEISFLKNYTLITLEGLVENISNLPEETAKKIILMIEEYMDQYLSIAESQKMKRVLFAIERKVLWSKLKEQRLSEPKVFDDYLERIIKFYPDPSYERDHLLETIGLGLALSTDEINKIWNLKYEQQVRWPEQKESAAIRTQFEVLEKLRAYMSMLGELEKSSYLIWFMGGEMPIAEEFSVEKTGISLQNRKDLFWQLNSIERRILLYDLLIGSDGLFLETGSVDSDYEHSPEKYKKQPLDRVKYIAKSIIETIFDGKLIDDTLPEKHKTNVNGMKLIKDIFVLMFEKQPSATRRAELLISLVEGMAASEKKGEELEIGQLIKILFKRAGVIVQKIGQVLSEQPELLPEPIKKALAELKEDRASPFSKRADQIYLQATGWIQNDKAYLSGIGEPVSSASIKQVREGFIGNVDEKVAIKVKKPSINKDYTEDCEVAAQILDALKNEYDIPGFLLEEAKRLVIEELSFENEVENCFALSKSLTERHAGIFIQQNEGEIFLPITIPKLFSNPVSSERECAKKGLIVEEFVSGLSLKDLMDYKEHKTKNLRKKIIKHYSAERISEIDQFVDTLDLDTLKAEIALEMITQMIRGGVFHSDLHTGNIFLDFGKTAKSPRLILLDLGSCGYSKSSAMSLDSQKNNIEQFDLSDDYRDFLSSLFALKMRTEKIAEIVNKYTGLSWDSEKVDSFFNEKMETGDKVKELFNAILKEAGGELDQRFRMFLKALATSADHLDNLKDKVNDEFSRMADFEDEESANKTFFMRLINENLLNPELLI